MKTARERAEEFLSKMAINSWEWDGMVDNFEIALKEQDKITRHACAEAVQTYAIKDGYDKNGTLIQTSLAVAECMNVKAV